jgi:hypothetical protein
MSLPKARKILLVIGVGLLLVQIPWFLVIQAIVNKTQVKTVATVIRIESKDAGCTGDRPDRPDSTCDHSPREYPVYEYTDASGKRYEQDDRFFGEYKQNNPIRGLFWKDVGDKVTAYYTKDKPQKVLFMAGPLAYTAWLIPLYVSIPILIAMITLVIIQKLRK